MPNWWYDCCLFAGDAAVCVPGFSLKLAFRRNPSKIVYIYIYIFFFSLSLFHLLPLSPLFFLLPPLFDFIFVGLLFHSSTSFLIIISSSLLPFPVLLSPLPPVPFISHVTTRLVSLPEYLQFKCHQSRFSPCCFWSNFSLHIDDKASNQNIL